MKYPANHDPIHDQVSQSYDIIHRPGLHTLQYEDNFVPERSYLISEI